MSKKRNLCLAAAAVACAAGAHAQSSVAIWGVMDLNVQHYQAGGVGSRNGVGSGSLSTSKLGFRGVEDLGGGLNAGFWLESSLNADTGTGRASNSNNQPNGAGVAGSLTFDRRSYVDLGGPWGQVRLGHDFVPTHYNSIFFDAFGACGVARAGNFTFSGVTGAPLPTEIVASNTVSYWTPKNLGGFYGVAMYGFGENASNVANPHDGNLRSVRLGYAHGPFDVAGAYSRTTYASTAKIGDYTHANLGASWNAGFAKFFALYNQVRVDVLGGPVRKDSWFVGARIPVGSFGRLRLTYGHLNDHSASGLVNANGTLRAANDATQFGVGFVHDLSKRTAVYGTYARISNQGQATYTVSGGPAPAAGRASSGIEVGVRHSF